MQCALESNRRGRETISQHKVSFACDRWCEQRSKVARVVFEISVLDQDAIFRVSLAQCVDESAANRRAFAAILRMEQHFRIARISQRCHECSRWRIRSIIDEHNLR